MVSFVIRCECSLERSIITSTEFATRVRFFTKTNSTTFTDSDILALMKVRQDELAKNILEIDEDILLIPQTQSLVADQREYPFPADILSNIKRVEAKLDATRWVKLTEIDLTSIKTAVSTETDITNNFSNSEGGARFDLIRKALYIYSGTITNVTGGLKLWCNTWMSALTSLAGSTGMEIDPSTTTHGIPRELHEIWARGVIIDYKQGKEKPIPLNESERNYKEDKKEALFSLTTQNLDREVTGSLPDSSTRGGNGANY